MKLKVVIVDDEPHGRNMINGLLQEFDTVEVVATAKNADEGLQAILKHEPDVAFIDIKMPNKSGFDLAGELAAYPQLSPEIIFLTAWGDEYALQAHEYAPFAFLQKPVDPDKLADKLLKLQHKRKQGDFMERLETFMKQINKITINTQTGYTFVNPRDVIYLEADGNYTHIYTGKNIRKTSSYNLGKVAEKFPPEFFFRISRSVLLNIEYLNDFDRKKRCCMLEKNGEIFEFEIASNYVTELKQFIENL